MQRIGIFGGTFNPPHIGHIQAAQQAMEQLNLGKLILIPTKISPHKEIPAGAPLPEQRLEMLRLAAEAYPRMEVSDMEQQRPGVSYTVDTLRQLQQLYPGAKLVLLMGTDMFLSLETWKEAAFLLKNATIAVFGRGEKGENQAISDYRRNLELQGVDVQIIANPAVEISSTQLRRMLAFHCADAFLTPTVADYIRKNQLYSVAADWRNLPMDALEQVVVSLLKPSRVSHVLGCRDTARELAQHWGADPVDAARAGLLHDITKALDGPLQLTLCRAYGKILDSFSQKYPKTLHALTGALVAERIFGENPAVVSAICSHTTGKAQMNTLEKIIYIADYMEPNRDFPGVEHLRRLAFEDLDQALELGLEMTLEHLKGQKSEVSPESRQALAYLKQMKSS